MTDGDFCIVCRRKPKGPRSLSFCRSCARSYDAAMAQDATILGVVEWTANRIYRLNRHRRASPKEDGHG